MRTMQRVSEDDDNARYKITYGNSGGVGAYYVSYRKAGTTHRYTVASKPSLFRAKLAVWKLSRLPEPGEDLAFYSR